MLQGWIDSAVTACIRHSKLVIAAALVVAALSAVYAARHFAIDTDINNLISERLPWRQNEIAFQNTFPQTVELILVDVGAHSPEAAKAAARDVQEALAKRPDLFSAVPEQLANAQPLISGLVRDPSLRGLVQVLVGILDYAKQGYVKSDDMARPLTLAGDTLDGGAQGRPVGFFRRPP